MADFSPGLRVGAFVCPWDGDFRTEWMDHVPCMIKANIPVYVHWPAPGAEGTWGEIVSCHPFLRLYLPRVHGAPALSPLYQPVRFPQRPFIVELPGNFRWEDYTVQELPKLASSPVASANLATAPIATAPFAPPPSTHVALPCNHFTATLPLPLAPSIDGVPPVSSAGLYEASVSQSNLGQKIVIDQIIAPVCENGSVSSVIRTYTLLFLVS